MKHLSTLLGFAAIVGIVILGGVTHGRMTGRWGLGSDMQAAGEKLEELPTEFGLWKQVGESRPFDDSTLRQLEPAGYVERTYVNRDTGEQIGMMMVVGRVGPIAVHTPEVCVSSQGYETRGKRQPVPIKTPDGLNHSVWSLDFRSLVDGHRLQTYYAWSTGGPWLAVDDPRWPFAGEPYLYKVQLTVMARAGSAQSDVGLRFLRDLFPVAQKYLIEPRTE